MRLHDEKSTLWMGASPSQARAGVVLIHGRGSSAGDMAGLVEELPQDGIAFAAPEASGGTWYPQRFLVPLDQNEPWLSAALAAVDRLMAKLIAAGIPAERVGLAGFSQGACLALEYAYRNPRRYGFVAGMSGALIGPMKSARERMDLLDTPVLLGCAEKDAHIPLPYFEESVRIFTEGKAKVTPFVFQGSEHRVFPEEFAWLGQQVKALVQGGDFFRRE